MRQKNRLIAYILLNIIVSALTTLLVLWIWDRPHANQVDAPSAPFAQSTVAAMMTSSANQSAAGAVENAAGSTAEGTPVPMVAPADAVVKIQNIFGAGSLNDEVVIVINESPGSVLMSDWKIDDGNGNTFVFPEVPQLLLNKGGAAQIHTAAGVNTVIDLYWSRDNPVWEVGKTAILLDPDGNIHDSYRIP